MLPQPPGAYYLPRPQSRLAKLLCAALHLHRPCPIHRWASRDKLVSMPRLPWSVAHLERAEAQARSTSSSPRTSPTSARSPPCSSRPRISRAAFSKAARMRASVPSPARPLARERAMAISRIKISAFVASVLPPSRILHSSERPVRVNGRLRQPLNCFHASPGPDRSIIVELPTCNLRAAQRL